MKKTDAKTVSTKFKYNDIEQSGRSIIEDWKNPPKVHDGILQSDELYEERAIDVVVDYHQGLSKKNGITDINDTEGNVMKQKFQDIGTIRSIPIKKYQASIAHNVGTLRRSEASQLQFESSISETEKNLYKGSKYTINPTNDTSLLTRERYSFRTPEATRASKHTEITGISRKSCHSCEKQRENQGEVNSRNSKLRTLDKRIVRSEQNTSVGAEIQENSDFDDYFHRSSSRRLNSKYQRTNDPMNTDERSHGKVSNTRPKRSKNGKVLSAKKWETINLQRGNVGQKISAYEENARRSSRNWETKCQFPSEVRKHRTIGVPLVGMHNACGLPVVASWHDHELLEPLRITNKQAGTLRSVLKRSRTPYNTRHRTRPKRKAPQPNENLFKKNDCTITKNVATTNGKILRKKDRRPSFKSTKVGTSSLKSSIKRTGKSKTSTSRKNSLRNSQGSKTLSIGSAKRKTLYARDDGEDAVEVLKSLCLNPLAHSKSASGMMW